jgi:Ubiquitin carboxyl-terminal hydrolase
MEPYTAEGMAWREAQVSSTPADLADDSSLSRQSSVVLEGQSPSTAMPTTPIKSSLEALPMEVESAKSATLAFGNGLCVGSTAAVSVNHINYELIGVVVHSGQANAGHYYSFIKDRRFYFYFYCRITN